MSRNGTLISAVCQRAAWLRFAECDRFRLARAFDHANQPEIVAGQLNEFPDSQFHDALIAVAENGLPQRSMTNDLDKGKDDRRTGKQQRQAGRWPKP